jgi:hypothetical protein
MGRETPPLTPENEALVKMKTQNALPEIRKGAGSFGKYFSQMNYFVGTTS